MPLPLSAAAVTDSMGEASGIPLSVSRNYNANSPYTKTPSERLKLLLVLWFEGRLSP